MQRTTRPPDRSEPPVEILLDGEFEELLEARGADLVEINPENLDEIAEGNGNGNDLSTMLSSAPMEKAMAARGITKDFLAQQLMEALAATKVTVFLDQKTGQIIYSKNLVYWKIREEARKDAHKLLRHYPPERQEVSGPDGSPINLKAGPAVQAIIQEIEVTVLGGESPNTPMDGP